MRFRIGPRAGDERETGRLEQELREHSAAPGPPSPPEAYWQNLLVRTNTRIDQVASGRAITISWAARVAVPGVVALLSFLVALHYYAPDNASMTSLPVVVGVLPDATLDSLVTSAVGQGAEEVLDERIAENLFALEKTAAAEYLIATASASSLLDSLEEQDVTDLLVMLGSRID